MIERPLYDRRARLYDAFISVVGHRAAVRRYLATQGELLNSDTRVLDAGCGTGALIEALTATIDSRGLSNVSIDGFDISNRMLGRLRRRLGAKERNLRLHNADVLELNRDLPADWSNYDLIVSSGMLEYVSPTQLARALGNLRDRLAQNGTVVVFISRDSKRNRFFIGKLWQAHLYTEQAVRERFTHAGLAIKSLEPFERWGFVVVATR